MEGVVNEREGIVLELEESFELGEEYSTGMIVVDGDDLSGAMMLDGRGGAMFDGTGGNEPKLIRFAAA